MSPKRNAGWSSNLQIFAPSAVIMGSVDLPPSSVLELMAVGTIQMKRTVKFAVSFCSSLLSIVVVLKNSQVLNNFSPTYEARSCCQLGQVSCEGEGI